MKRAIPVIVILLELLSIKPTFASLLVVKNEGEIVWNVLAEEDNLSLDVPKHSYLEVTKIAQVNPSESSLVVLKRQDGKISLSVDSGDEKKQLDVTNWKEDVIEVEERAEVKKLVINFLLRLIRNLQGFPLKPRVVKHFFPFSRKKPLILYCGRNL